MKLADLHCDATWKAVLQNGVSEDANETMLAYHPDARIQAFAVFLPEDCDGKTMFAKQIGIYRSWQKLGLVSKDTIFGFTTLENAGKLPENQRTSAFLSEHQVRFATLTWNGENELAGGCLTDVGIKPQGKTFLKEMKAAGTLPDLSHLSDLGVADVFRMFDGPVVASHSDCRAICNHPRNLTDDMIREIFARNGIIGVNLHAPFVTDSKCRNTEESCLAVLRHMEHFLAFGGEHKLALGCDYDGGTPIFGLNSAENLEKLYITMVKYLGQSLTDGIFYQNAADFLLRFS